MTDIDNITESVISGFLFLVCLFLITLIIRDTAQSHKKSMAGVSLGLLVFGSFAILSLYSFIESLGVLLGR